MKKLAVYVVVITIGVLLSFPMVSGIKLKEAYLQRIGAMPKQPGVMLFSESYDRGWFRSSAVTRVELDLEQWLGAAEYTSEPINILVRSDFYHGPVLLTDLGLRFGLGYGSLSLSGSDVAGVEQALSEWMQAAPLTVRTLINLDQSAHTEITIAAYEADHGDDHIRFGGINASLITDANLTKFDGSMRVNASSVLTTGYVMDVAESSGSMSYQGKNPYTMVGETVFSFPSVSITGKEVSTVIQGLNLNSGTQLNQGKLDYFQTIEVDSVESPLPITSGRWHLEFTGLSPAGLEAWSDFSLQLQELSQAGQLPLDEAGEPELPPELEAKMEQIMQELLQPGLGFSQRLDVQALGTGHSAEMALSFVGLPGTTPLSQVEDPMQYLQAFKGDLDVELDEQSILQSPLADSLMPFVQQGLLMPQDGKLVMQVRLADGILLLNGSPVPIDALLQSAMAPETESDMEAETELAQ
ncbi:DUF945 family protein [Ketobacter alkanivorans]|uniref:DUF945 domain-containing protein n=1 Tax=Ketobacter alkanivorans TaxID=1917421 RepID=A0A2K9LIV0_9GAMM|nr:DUF945 family protein [Ketobacter alkanivorans]AUM12202.1 hypothetical protein Kalk_07170 [Ketobacter alkanivorans]